MPSIPIPWPRSSLTGALYLSSTAFATQTIKIAVEIVRIGWQHLEPLVADIAAIEIAYLRAWRDAHTGVTGIAIAARCLLRRVLYRLFGLWLCGSTTTR